jgi:hypothetical protein
VRYKLGLPASSEYNGQGVHGKILSTLPTLQ